jgi:hypothetical protein
VTEIVAWASRTAVGSAAWVDGALTRAMTLLARAGARVAAEWCSLCRPSAAGAFHGEQPPADGYLTMMRATWGRP